DVTDATYDAENRLLTWAGKTYSYDHQGNLTSDGTEDFVWDDRNRLAAIQRGGGTGASFQYDTIGRGVGKTIGAATSGFVVDHGSVVQELDGVTNTAPVRAHLLNGGFDEVFLRAEGNSGTSLQSVLSDGGNNTLGLLDASATSSVSYTYDP